MTRRAVMGVAAGLGGALAVGGGAVAVSAHGGRQGIMKRVAAAVIGDALDEARVTPRERVEIHGNRDRVFGTVERYRTGRQARPRASQPR